MQARDRIDYSSDPIERELDRQTRRAALDLTKLLLPEANIAAQHGKVIGDPVISLEREVATTAAKTVDLRLR